MSSIATIEELNADQLLDDVKIQWCGQVVILWHAETGKILTRLTVDGGTVAKVVNWCRKNSYRCTQVQGGRIML